MPRIAVIPGDGIGPEVTEVGVGVLEAVVSTHAPDWPVGLETLPFGSELYRRTGALMPPDGLEQLAGFDAILFGAVGAQDIPDHVTLWGLRLAVVQGFDQAISLRPARLLPGVRGPLADRGPEDVDLVVVRENTEGEYAGAGGFSHRGMPGELALQTTVFTRACIERTARFAFDLARDRPAHRLASITKSNASLHACVLWDEVVAEVAQDYPDIAWESVLVDAAAARLVLAPEGFDVILASNLHGDVLSDLTGALAGSLGMAPSANLSLDGSRPSMYEPVHGSAFDLVGRGVANPVGMVLSMAMMLDGLDRPELAEIVRRSVEQACADGVMTGDVGGKATTQEVADALVAGVRADELVKGGTT
ncbi:MAG TPA: isocitrate/isopropylmalate family dehydrogenase [Solirubrobacter sp.]|nr:isocitrate/isopropylmalate family dehydrogenase [Solirubrobacter sp.]